MSEAPKNKVKDWPIQEIQRAEREIAATRRELGQPSVNNHGVHIDIADLDHGLERTEWATRHRAAQVISERGTSISGTGLSARLKKNNPNHETRDIVLPNNWTVEGIRIHDAELAVMDLALIGISLDESGIHVTGKGRRLATVSAMIQKFRVQKPTIERRLEGVRKMRARNYLGRPTWIYDIEEVESKLSPLLEGRKNPVKVDENGYYEDAEKVLWATIDAFYASLDKELQRKTSNSALRRYAQKHCDSRPALDREGRINAEVYPVEDLKALPIFTNEIRVDSDGLYTDEDGEHWASRNTWQEIFRVSQKAMDRGVGKRFENWDQAPSIKGFGLAKREDDLYSYEAISEALSYIFDAENLVVNNVLTVIEETQEGVKEALYLSPEELTKIFPEDVIPRYKYRRKFEAERVDGIDRNHGGNISTFSLDAVIDHFRDQIQGVLDSIEESEEGDFITLSEYLEKHPEIDKKTLIANTDNLERVMRKREGKIVYMYKEGDLDGIANAG